MLKSNLNRSSRCEWFAEISSIAEASRIRLNPNSSRRIAVHTLIVSNRESKFRLILRWGRLAEFELFGNNPVARDAERPELSGDVPYETLLTAQHHCIVVQGRNVRCNLSCGDPPTARC